jgi:hypothetical protein
MARGKASFLPAKSRNLVAASSVSDLKKAIPACIRKNDVR